MTESPGLGAWRVRGSGEWSAQEGIQGKQRGGGGAGCVGQGGE